MFNLLSVWSAYPLLPGCTPVYRGKCLKCRYLPRYYQGHDFLSKNGQKWSKNGKNGQKMIKIVNFFLQMVKNSINRVNVVRNWMIKNVKHGQTWLKWKKKKKKNVDRCKKKVAPEISVLPRTPVCQVLACQIENIAKWHFNIFKRVLCKFSLWVCTWL